MLARAKVNLYLDVLGRRPDGFHEIETVLLALPWGDDVEVAVTTESGEGGVHLEVEPSDADVPTGRDNLACRAARAWLDAAGRIDRTVRIRLVKRIPTGAGLGGGSSDAAAVLSCLEGAAGTLGEARLQEVAASLGSDVPFFLLPGDVAVGRGRGERLEVLPRPAPFDVILILSGTPHDTAAVYGRVDPAAPVLGGLPDAVAALASGVPARLRTAARNALAPAACRAYPSFALFVEAVARRLGHPPLLSGTGSTLFDILDPGEVDATLSRLEGLDARVLHIPARA